MPMSAAARCAAHEVLQAVFPELKRAGKVAKQAGARRSVKPISIRGLTEGISYNLGQCCHPLPGDRIVGIDGAGRGARRCTPSTAPNWTRRMTWTTGWTWAGAGRLRHAARRWRASWCG